MDNTTSFSDAYIAYEAIRVLDDAINTLAGKLLITTDEAREILAYTINSTGLPKS